MCFWDRVAVLTAAFVTTNLPRWNPAPVAGLDELSTFPHLFTCRLRTCNTNRRVETFDW